MKWLNPEVTHGQEEDIYITTRKAFSSLSIIFSLCPQLAGLRGWVQKQWRKGHSIKQSKRFFKAGIMPSTPGVEPSALSHGC
jgi:hypothetical protein